VLAELFDDQPTTIVFEMDGAAVSCEPHNLVLR
jgi:hypothetical protein